MQHPFTTRRAFVLGSATAVGLGAFGLAGRSVACPTHAGAHAAAEGRIAAADEPGEPMEIHGTIYAADGVTPAAGVVLYVYHTDAAGLYRPGDGVGNPRLRAHFKTDANGRYAYRTIRPGHYPGGQFAAHVHTQLWGDGVPPHWGTTLLFTGDRSLSDAERRESAALGRFANIRPLTRTAGVWHGVHDIRLKTTADTFEPHTRHGLDV